MTGFAEEAAIAVETPPLKSCRHLQENHSSFTFTMLGALTRSRNRHHHAFFHSANTIKISLPMAVKDKKIKYMHILLILIYNIYIGVFNRKIFSILSGWRIYRNSF